MIKVLEDAIEKVKKLPKERQEFAAEVLEQIAGDRSEAYAATEEERALLREGLEELDRGEAATDEQVRAVFDKYRA
jgi:predicted transcriptional regulator